MNKIAEYKGAMARRCAQEKAPFGMGLAEGLATRTEAVIIYGSSFADPPSPSAQTLRATVHALSAPPRRAEEEKVRKA